VNRTLRVLVLACLAVTLLAGSALAALPLLASTEAGGRVGAMLSSVPILADLPLIVGTDRGERLTGTKNAEKILGLGGADEITDGLDADLVYGGTGRDNLIGYGGDTSLDRFYGGRGNDVVQSRDVPAVEDAVSCGGGTDTVYADKKDSLAEDCERVRVR
jgi:Ca2+-binding RTX toxin-like protein